MRDSQRQHFDTPSWLGPPRHDSPAPEPVLPAQAEPVHDTIAPDHVPAALTGPPPEVPESAHWEERRRRQFLAGSLLLVTFLGAVFYTTLAILQRSPGYGAAAGGCLVALVLVRSMLMSAGLTTVDLRGSRLTVRRDGFVDTVDLASPYTILELRGDPRARDWRLAVETTDGRLHEIGPQQCDPVALDAAVRYYRELAQGHGPHHDDIRWRG